MFVNYPQSIFYYYTPLEEYSSIPPGYMPYYLINISSSQNNSTAHQESYQANSQKDQQHNIPIPQHNVTRTKRLNYKKSSLKKRKSGKISKKIQSAKKNSEGNLTNQLFSFFRNPSKSYKYFAQAIKRLRRTQDEEKLIRLTFYDIIALINIKRGRKYINKNTILKYFNPESLIRSLPSVTSILEEVKTVNLQDICRLIRIISFHFMRSISPLEVLTSKKIMLGTKKEHLRRRRLVIQTLEEASD